MLVSIFTPTFNRGYIISNLYYSLKRQTTKDFEWIIVDDGSSDNTMDLINNFILNESDFNIILINVKNGGKHRAINKGLKFAKGKLFFIVDSDDYLTDDAVQNIIEFESTISDDLKNEFAGICLNRGYSNNELIGTTFEDKDKGKGFIDITMLERPKFNIFGDKAEVFYTDILKKYPFPEFEGENFLTECIVWDQIAYDGLKLRFFNNIIYICNYLPDGLTSNENKLFGANPAGYGLYIYQCGKFGKKTGIAKWDSYYNFYCRNVSKLGIKTVAKYLHIKPTELVWRVFGLKIFYKLYS